MNSEGAESGSTLRPCWFWPSEGGRYGRLTVVASPLDETLNVPAAAEV
jgi:hypothetical protein